MNKPAKKRSAKIESELDETLARLLQTDKKELEDEIERTKREADEADQYVRERQESIRRGARRAPKRFRI